MSNKIQSPVAELMTWLKEFATTRINFRLQNRRRCIQPHVILEFGEHGVFGIQVPKDYHGLEFNHTDSCRVIEQLGGIDLTLAAFVGQNNMGIRPIVEFGTAEQKKEFLPAFAKGRILASFAITEPGAGSNVAQISGTLQPVSEKKYKLNARKIWIGMGSWSGVTCVIARHQEDKVSNRMTACLVRAGTKGYYVGEESLTIGMRGAVQNHLFFKDVIVNESDILGLPEQGLQVANNTMELTRLGIGAMSLGAMKRCFLFAHRYASRRKVNTGLLYEHPLTQIKMNIFIAKIKALESLVYTTTRFLDAGINLPVEVYAVAKVMGSEFLGQTIDEAMQMLGARGYTENNIIPYFFTDARALRIFEGPSEVLTHYSGSLATIKSRRKNLFELFQAADLLRYFDQLDDIFAQLNKQEVTISFDENWKNTVRGQTLSWLLLLATARLRHQHKQFSEFSLVDSWLIQQIEYLFEQTKHCHFYKHFIHHSAINNMQKSFDFIDITQDIPDEDTIFDDILK